MVPACVVRLPEKQDSVAPELLLDDAAMLAVLQRNQGRRVTRKTRLCSRDCDVALAGVLSKGSHPAKATPGPAVVE